VAEEDAEYASLGSLSGVATPALGLVAVAPAQTLVKHIPHPFPPPTLYASAEFRQITHLSWGGKVGEGERPEGLSLFILSTRE